ncbi:glycogen synthase [Desulfogranum mediterraneum]|uniref:glycogen synthase n=1 Tax=Desulfogranum mediterraneum TaxID=160661 RepID=UPI00041A9110|nr:glycogen/starch synthase [Desulfogranum mediterraneum]
MEKVDLAADRSSTEPRVIWLVSREYDGLAGAGGVKDVCRQLGQTLASVPGYQVRVILPCYGFMDPEALGFEPLHLDGLAPAVIRGRSFPCCFSVDMDYVDQPRRETVAIWEQCLDQVTVYLVEAERFGEKMGVYTYTQAEEERLAWQAQGSGHYDYFAMNILLQKAALDLMLLQGQAPWVIHCQDGHAATLPVMMRENSAYRHFFRQTGAVVTIHNAGLGYHQEVADLDFAGAVTGLSRQVIQAGLLGLSFDPLVAAAGYAVLNTVSEQYALELQETSEDARTGWLGHSLKQRGEALLGVTNGIDPESFNPLLPEPLGLAAAFDIPGGRLAGKQECKAALLRQLAQLRQWKAVEQFGRLKGSAEQPLFTFIGRLTEQKGVDILLSALEEVLEANPGTAFLVLGSGDSGLEQRLQELSRSAGLLGRLCFLKGFDPGLATQVYAAGDFFLIPSRYEPCGLTDYIAQLLGNLPIVHHVGGLVKVIDGLTGFAYQDNSSTALMEAMGRALEVYQQPEILLEMQQAAVQRISDYHTWDKVMLHYIRLYEQARAILPGAGG